MSTYLDALNAQRDARRISELPAVQADYEAGRLLVQPRRITQALDIGAMYGPGVDRACLAEEPAVDQWEAGEAAPSWRQLQALSILTSYPIGFFLRPVTADELGPVWICGAGPCQIIDPSPAVAPFGSVTPPMLEVIQ